MNRQYGSTAQHTPLMSSRSCSCQERRDDFSGAELSIVAANLIPTGLYLIQYLRKLV